MVAALAPVTPSAAEKRGRAGQEVGVLGDDRPVPGTPRPARVGACGRGLLEALEFYVKFM